MNILVTGAAGMLGSELVPALGDAHNNVVATDLIRTGSRHLDVRVPDEIASAFKQVKPDLVVHLAALTDLEECEGWPTDAWYTNALGTKYVALACRKAVIPMAYVSTAGVFDGTKSEPYTEFDIPEPINVYGASKLEGEFFVREYVPESFVVRAGWMMGGGPAKDHKFVSLILNQLAESATETIYAVHDKFGSPTYAKDFSQCFAALIGSDRYGTYHMVSEGSCSRFDIAQAIVETQGRTDVTVLPVPSTTFDPQYWCPRPASEALRNMVLDLEGRNTMRPWRVALEEYLKEWV